MKIFALFLFLNCFAGTPNYIGDVPRQLVRKYEEIRAKSSQRFEVYVCQKKGEPPVHLAKYLQPSTLVYRPGQKVLEDSGIAPRYREGAKCNELDMKKVIRPAEIKIPKPVMEEFDKNSKQKLYWNAIQVCQKGEKAILGLSWSTGYVGGFKVYSLEGKKLGENTADDTGDRHTEFELKDFQCDLIHPL